MSNPRVTAQKRLGQYFTPEPVAALAAAATVNAMTRRIIDPMAGDGVMMRAVRERTQYMGWFPPTAVAVEIDTKFESTLREVSTPVMGDVFSLAGSLLVSGKFDAVIGNPPYVRYEDIRFVESEATRSLRGAVRKWQPQRTDSAVALDAIRAGLIATVMTDPLSVDAAIGVLAGAAPEDVSAEARHWIRHVQGMSGRVDLYLPAWLLTWPLLAEGGRVAFVTSTAWQSRRYGRALGSFLSTFYEPVVAIEQEGPTWFGTAQVATSLVILEKRRAEGTRTGRLRTLHVPRTYFLGSQDGVTSLARALSGSPTSSLPEAANTIITAAVQGETGPWRSDWRDLVSGSAPLASAPVHLAAESPIRHHLPGDMTGTDFLSLAELGVSVHQGLRTGFNPFFYLKPGASESALNSIENNYLLPVVHQQSELDRLPVKAIDLKTRLVHTGYGVHPDDYSRLAAYPNEWVEAWRSEHGLHVLPPGVARHISSWEAVTVDRPAGPVRVPDLTAVAPNEHLPQADRPTRPEPPRFWYRISLRDRHRPDLFVPRIVDSRLRAYWNVDRAVVDANFSTLLCASEGVGPAALLTVLNSTWVQGLSEVAGTPLGGGALKVEAAHLRTLTIPRLTKAEWEVLNRIGLNMKTMDDNTLEAVDEIVMAAAARALSITPGLVARLVGDLVARHVRRRNRAA